ncbi:RNA polymerase sigma factor [Oceanihabitans sediminis]|uniref:RNA polymerase sigma factor n=1 Tax=Oceanihabitans sediminis TaxID=1812012 RepID=A0A368P432_9FLAO|nr:RNA polymerase sigma factor [Oceanihabitans sediminis]MDX1278954.1 RNA polymerase sigma factor [Oceanihabitans sediminis]MDX1774573.1 RNA polymerase sigma factor [Oceanihabitans sediminis]RBP29030.1 RNA polymerase sigma-70 factor (ECF subfamily) [Oceanihabitans sediminis]RCU57040.1 RNA polymerase sigma factor [Oceanihabitans sediminis]
MLNETLLINQLKSNQTKEQAFKELVSLYKERLYWHIRHIVKSHDDTDDVLQNTFIKVFRNIDNFKGDSKIYSWMYRIATNEAISFINKNAKRLQTTNEEAQDLAINNLQSDVYFEGDEIQLKLQKAIATLPQKQQIVFNMRYFQDIKYKDMAEILETSEGALKASYHIAVKKIEDYLTQD